MGGQPCIRRNRFTLEHVLTPVGAGWALEQIQADFPFIEVGGLQQVGAYAAFLVRESRLPVPSPSMRPRRVRMQASNPPLLRQVGRQARWAGRPPAIQAAISACTGQWVGIPGMPNAVSVWVAAFRNVALFAHRFFRRPLRLAPQTEVGGVSGPFVWLAAIACRWRRGSR